MAAGLEKCSYLEDISRLNRQSQNVLYFVLGGTIACPRCSRPNAAIYHKLEYQEEKQDAQKVDQT